MRTRLAFTAILAAAPAVILTTASAPAAVSCTKFAAPTGSDSAAGTEADPYRTAQKLVNSLSAGQTGCLRAGTYSQGTLRFSKAGASGAPITLTSYPGETATVSGGTVYVPAGSDFVTVRDLKVDGAAKGAPTVQVMAYDTELSGNTITNQNSGESCVILGSFAGFGDARRTRIAGNRLQDCGSPSNGLHDHAIYVENSVGAEIVDNVFSHAAAWAVQLYPNAQGTRIAHNVMDGSSGGIVLSGESAGGEYAQDYASSGTVIEQNLITNATAEYNVQSWWGGPKGTGNVVRSNCVYNGEKGDIDTSDGGFTASGNKTADPQYVNRAARDYRMKAGSPCLAVVGYDTAAKLAGGDPDPAPTPIATPVPVPPLPTPQAGPVPALAAQPVATEAAHSPAGRVLHISGPARLHRARPRFRVALSGPATVRWTLRAGGRAIARGSRRVSGARTITLRPRVAKRKLRRMRGHRLRLVVRTVRPT
jgi:hypothetical protein